MKYELREFGLDRRLLAELEADSIQAAIAGFVLGHGLLITGSQGHLEKEINRMEEFVFITWDGCEDIVHRYDVESSKAIPDPQFIV